MANRHTETCTASLITRETQIKTTMRHHLMPGRRAAIKKAGNNTCWWGCGENEAVIHCWWECKSVQPLWKTTWRFLKILGIELPFAVVVQLLSCFWPFVTSRTAAHQASLSFTISRSLLRLMSSYPTSGCLSKEYNNTNLKRYSHLYVHHGIIYNSQDMEAT